MSWKKNPHPPCRRCGDEGSEHCHLCSRFLCENCLGRHRTLLAIGDETFLCTIECDG